MSSNNIKTIKEKFSSKSRLFIVETNDPLLNFYPPVKNFEDSEREYDIFNKEKEPLFLNNGLKEDNKSDAEYLNTYEVNQNFFGCLISPKNDSLDKKKKINTISKIIRKSKLMEKLEKEFTSSDKKIDLSTLSYMCAKNLLFMELKKGKILFRVGDMGDRFYLILSGKITILKPKKVIYKMNLQEYLLYLRLLLNEKENFLFNEVIMQNCTNIPITNIEEIKNIFRILFILDLRDKVLNGIISNNKELAKFFEENQQEYIDYDLDSKFLEILETKNNKLIINKNWNTYILEKCVITKGDMRTLGRYKEYNNKKHVICYVYEIILYMGPGFFFGDAALEEKVNKRNATIRAEEDCILGFLKSADYANMILPQRKIEKMKEVNFLINNYFFKNINVSFFEKNLFHHFILNEYSRGTVLFNSEDMPKNLIFLKEGQISLSIKCSIFDINNIIEFICDKVILENSEELLQKKIITKGKIRTLKRYVDEDEVLSNLKEYTKEFNNEINKKRTFQIAMVNSAETIGLEEIFLQIPYITQGVVMSEKMVSYDLEVEKMKAMLLETNLINYNYLKTAISKIFSLIERLYNLKQNWIDIAKMRHETKKNFRKKNLPTLKNNIFYQNPNQNQNQNSRRIYSTLVQNSSSASNSPIHISINRKLMGGNDINKNKEYTILSYSENKSNKKDKDSDINDMYNNKLIYRSPLLQVPMTKKNVFQSIILDTINKSIDAKSKKFNKRKNGIFNSNINLNININIRSSGNIKRSKYADFFQYLVKSKKNNIDNYKLYKLPEQSEENGKLSEMLNNNNGINSNGNGNNSMNKRIGSAFSSSSNDAIQIGSTFITLDGIKRQIQNSDLNLLKERKKLSKIIRQSRNNINIENQNVLSTNNSIESHQKTIEKEIIPSSLNEKKESSFIIKKSQYGKNFHLNFVPLLNDNERYNNYHPVIKTNENVNFKNKYLISLINKNHNIKSINATSKRNLILQKNKSFKDKNKLILQKILLNKKSMSNNNIFNKAPILKKDVGTDTCDIKLQNPKPEPHLNSIDFSDKIENDKPKLPSIRKRIKLINSDNLKIGKILEGINNKEFMPEIIKQFYNDKKKKGYVSLIPKKEFNTLFLRRYHKKYKNEENSNSNNSNKEKV